MTTGHCSVPLKMFSLAQMDVSGQKWHLDLVVCVCDISPCIAKHSQRKLAAEVLTN